MNHDLNIGPAIPSWSRPPYHPQPGDLVWNGLKETIGTVVEAVTVDHVTVRDKATGKIYDWNPKHLRPYILEASV